MNFQQKKARQFVFFFFFVFFFSFPPGLYLRTLWAFLTLPDQLFDYWGPSGDPFVSHTGPTVVDEHCNAPVELSLCVTFFLPHDVRLFSCLGASLCTFLVSFTWSHPWSIYIFILICDSISPVRFFSKIFPQTGLSPGLGFPDILVPA